VGMALVRRSPADTHCQQEHRRRHERQQVFQQGHLHRLGRAHGQVHGDNNGEGEKQGNPFQPNCAAQQALLVLGQDITPACFHRSFSCCWNRKRSTAISSAFSPGGVNSTRSSWWGKLLPTSAFQGLERVNPPISRSSS